MGCMPMDDQDTGTLYVLANQDHSLAKIGLTRNGTPVARADAYARDHGIQWHVYWSAVTDNVADAEAAAHRALQDRRFSLLPEAREVFHVTPQKAVRIVEQFVVTSPGIAQPQQPHQQRIPWLRYAEVAAAFAIAYWPMLRRLHRRLRATLRAGHL
jgi:hypothetical protein